MYQVSNEAICVSLPQCAQYRLWLLVTVLNGAFLSPSWLESTCFLHFFFLFQIHFDVKMKYNFFWTHFKEHWCWRGNYCLQLHVEISAPYHLNQWLSFALLWQRQQLLCCVVMLRRCLHLAQLGNQFLFVFLWVLFSFISGLGHSFYHDGIWAERYGIRSLRPA